MKGSNSNASIESNTSLQDELELLLLLQEQHNRRLILERERELNINRSGSAPPTIEGALRAAGNLFGNPNFVQLVDSGSTGNHTASSGVLAEEEIRSHPAYLEYYYSNENLNPRLPPPLLSREDWRVAQRFRAAGFGLAVGDSGGSSSSFSMRASSSVKAQEDELELRKTALRNISRKNSTELLDKIATGSSSGMKVRRKSFADIVQEGLGQKATSGLSRTTSQNSIGDAAESSEATHTEKTFTPSSSAQNDVNARIGARLANNMKPVTSDTPNAPSSSIFEIADVTSSLSGLNMSSGQLHPEDILKLSHQMGMLMGHQKNQQRQTYLEKSRAEMLLNNINYANLTRSNGSTGDLNKSNSLIREPPPGFTRKASSMTNLQSLLNADSGNTEDPKMRPRVSNFPGSSTGATNDGNLRTSNQAGIHLPVKDPHYIPYIHGSNVPHLPENPYQGRSLGIPLDFGNMQALEKAYLEALLLQQIHQYQSQLLHKPINEYNVKPEFSTSSTSHQGNQTLNGLHSAATSKNTMFKNEKTAQGPSNLRTVKGEPTSSQHSQSGSSAKGRFESLLDLVKSNKTKSVQLSDVLTYVVEFSMDQYGSRFIQQKLESATVEEKAKIFREIIPHARALMTDVFGNYVIQKFFERGTDSQRKELAKHAIGHVLPLSLQMYGCRVIQKALEVVGVELQAEMVKELDGSVMKCVRDQNGNHVIQKCIERVPQHLIQFIILSFVGHVVTLSTHPYGCRVIQRVLEHCADPKTKQVLMDEILGSVCNLAQDQYGNYVIQHGKPHERSVIINKLAGQIVKMSQHKFASNVVEMCLTVGVPDERKILVNEILGSTDENEPLQAMMKDPFGNYVVQKVLETCDDQNRELILSRIKVHLNALRKYTYAKQIVSRVEKLVAAGEKHVAQSSSSSST